MSRRIWIRSRRLYIPQNVPPSTERNSESPLFLLSVLLFTATGCFFFCELRSSSRPRGLPEGSTWRLVLRVPSLFAQHYLSEQSGRRNTLSLTDLQFLMGDSLVERCDESVGRSDTFRGRLEPLRHNRWANQVLLRAVSKVVSAFCA